jgi:predicted nuclease of predicted toxin-antitoxin system
VKLLIDMNLSPEWQPLLRENGFEAVHWSDIGAHDAPDAEIMQWARDNGCVVFTHDLDFGILLAHSKEGRPSVVQVRAQDVSPEHLGPVAVRALQAHGEALESGALLTIDEARSRVRILPI